MMKVIAGAIAVVALTAIGGVAPAAAQNLPRGSYLQSCTNARVEGDRLVALCRRGDGGMSRTALPTVDRCVGDIGNNNGRLVCNYAGQPANGGGNCADLFRRHRYLRHRLDDGGLSERDRRHLDRQLDEVRDQERADACRR